MSDPWIRGVTGWRVRIDPKIQPGGWGLCLSLTPNSATSTDFGQVSLQNFDNGDPSNFYWILFQISGGTLTPNGAPMTMPPLPPPSSDCTFIFVHEKTRGMLERPPPAGRGTLHVTRQRVDDGWVTVPMRSIDFKFEAQEAPFRAVFAAGMAQDNVLAMDVAGANIVAGNPVCMWNWEGADNQKWALSFSSNWP